MDKNNGLGAALRALRKMRGLTQAELARASGMERTSIVNIEAGAQRLNVTTINAIAGALGYRVRIKFERLPDAAPAQPPQSVEVGLE